jgi:hypothetical protein
VTKQWILQPTCNIFCDSKLIDNTLAVLAVVQNATEKPVLQLQLREEVDLLRDLYSTLLYGGETLPDAAKNGSHDLTVGALFKEMPHVEMLFSAKTCRRKGEVGCVQPEDEYHPVSMHAIDPMAQRLIQEAHLLSWDDPAMITPTSSRYVAGCCMERHGLGHCTLIKSPKASFSRTRSCL